MSRQEENLPLTLCHLRRPIDLLRYRIAWPGLRQTGSGWVQLATMSSALAEALPSSSEPGKPGNMSFQERERPRLAAYAAERWKTPGHVIPYKVAEETLQEEIRDGALAYFARHGITWWTSR